MDENKTKKKIVKGVGLGGAVVSGLALTPVAIGFGSAGIAAGSSAAFIQSLIGNVTAGGIFATMTSFGMTQFSQQQLRQVEPRLVEVGIYIKNYLVMILKKMLIKF